VNGDEKTFDDKRLATLAIEKNGNRRKITNESLFTQSYWGNWFFCEMNAAKQIAVAVHKSHQFQYSQPVLQRSLESSLKK
jgi:hypothetical protein